MVADGANLTESPADIRPPEVRQTSQHSIRRKPVAATSAQQVVPQLPSDDALLLARARSSDRASARSAFNYDRDSSPDYASTRKSEDNKSERSIPRPRTGVLKTVGDPSIVTDTSARPKSDIPEIDFGVTQSLTPGTSRPGTAMGFALGGNASGSGTGASPSGSRPMTPMGLGQSPGTPERKSPLRTPEALAEDRRSNYFGYQSHSRSPSYAWQPGIGAGRQSPGPALTPEEFVQQRAAAAQHPTGYIPQRTASINRIEHVAVPSQAPKKLQKKRDSRPSSRNSTHLLDYSSNLSAREQEHVARMTGGPLLNMGDRTRSPDPSVGLIGAIEAREQERKYIKEGVSGHMVQAAIAQRQHHAQAQQFQAHQEAQRSSMYGQQFPGYAQQYGQPQQPQFTSWGAPIDPQSNYQVWQGQGQAPGPPAQQWQNPQQHQQQQKYGGYY